jgi:guanidinopropionase
MIRAMHGATRQTPFKTMKCADMGDVAMSPVDQDEALAAAEAAMAAMLADGIRPLMVGGDHLCTLTVLRALRKASGGGVRAGASGQSHRSLPALFRG